MCEAFHSLKMLGLYLYTLIIGHKSCNMLGILNKLILLKELQTIVINNVFLDKKVKTQQQQQQNKKIKHKNICRSRGLNPGPLAPKADALPLHHRVNWEFDAMGRNVNKQSQICGPDIFNKYIFSGIFSHAWTTIFGSFSY